MSLSGQFNTRPLYQQVADEFISRIVSGVWQPGQAIENEAELARALGISLGTVRKAFEILSDYDLLERHQGKGTVIADQIGSRSRFSNIRDADDGRVSGEIDISEVRLATPDAGIAERLAINVRTPVLSFARRRKHAGRTFMVEEVFLRVDASAHEMDDERLMQLATLRWVNLDLATGMREIVSPAACEKSGADALGVDPGTCVLKLDRVISSYRGKPLEMRLATCSLGPDLHYQAS